MSIVLAILSIQGLALIALSWVARVYHFQFIGWSKPPIILDQTGWRRYLATWSYSETTPASPGYSTFIRVQWHNVRVGWLVCRWYRDSEIRTGTYPEHPTERVEMQVVPRNAYDAKANWRARVGKKPN